MKTDSFFHFFFFSKPDPLARRRRPRPFQRNDRLDEDLGPARRVDLLPPLRGQQPALCGEARGGEVALHEPVGGHGRQQQEAVYPSLAGALLDVVQQGVSAAVMRFVYCGETEERGVKK